MAPEPTGTSAAQPSGNSDSAGVDETSLVDVISKAHEAILRRAATLDEERERGSDRAVDAYDAEVATLSGHLAAVEAVLYPLARKRLPGGHAAVATQLRLARRIERLMRLIEGRFYGDTVAVPMSLDALQDELRQLVGTWTDGQTSIARKLEDVLSLDERRRVVTSLNRLTHRAPTRPHPYTPHSRGLAKLMFRACYVWDRAFDVMDNRVVPAMRPPRRLAPLNSWDRYFLGKPDFEDPQRDVRR